MVDELADFEKAAGKGDPLDKVHRQSRGYEVLEPIITAALRQSDKVEGGLADFLKASPVLAAYLARWQAK